jgi:peptidoglycan/xylan/chitin deacetylase (PgdA/CDA1 family)
LAAETEFSGLDLSPENTLLFGARADIPGGLRYHSLFAASLPDGPIEQLTFYPEHIQFVDEGRALLLQNRFGVFKTDQDLAKLAPVKGYPSFINGSQVVDGKIIVTQASPDGRYLLSIRPIKAAHGRLVLQDAQTGRETTVSPEVEYSLDAFPALWSPRSDFFCYSAAGNLYYFSMEHYLGKRVPDQKYRSLGPGRIASVRWSESGYLFFIKGRNLYRADPREFFTRTLYSPVLHTGDPVGEVPFAFDPNFDSFHVSPTGGHVLVVKDGRSLFLHEVKSDAASSDAALMMPYLRLPSNACVKRVLWPAFGPITVFADFIQGGQSRLQAFRLTDPEMEAPGYRAAAAAADPDKPLPRGVTTLRQTALALDLAEARDIAVSPDGTSLALALPGSVRILSYANLAETASFPAASPRLVLFRNKDQLAVAGDSFLELIDLPSGARRLLALSQAEAYGFSSASGALAVKAGGKAWVRQSDGSWKETAAFEVKPASTASDSYRVYLDEISRGSYRNAVMIRAVKTLRTSNLIVPPALAYQPFPEKDDPRQVDVFNHGSRIRRREVALVFDAMDDDEGLTRTLGLLESYGIKATFFVNGEFIRRHPASAAMLAESGHEIGSMFFATFNLADKAFGVDAEFVRRGLARNEDDWFAATGRELSAIWHAPFYTVNSDIVAWAKTLNYAYIGRDVDPLDWVSSADQYRFPGMYLDAAAIVERIMERKKPGSIIPVRLGIPEGGRGDYLYHRLDLLLNALIAEGYQVVPVSTLMDHAK